MAEPSTPSDDGWREIKQGLDASVRQGRAEPSTPDEVEAERYAEGTREPAECRKCGQPIWIVYHGPQANHTVEPRLQLTAAEAGAILLDLAPPNPGTEGTPEYRSGVAKLHAVAASPYVVRHDG